MKYINNALTKWWGLPAEARGEIICLLLFTLVILIGYFSGNRIDDASTYRINHTGVPRR